MTLINITIITFSFSAFLFSCCAQQQITNNQNPDNEITVVAGETFSIELLTHPGTGFSWQVRNVSDTTLVKLISYEYRELGDESLDFPGKDHFKFMALNKGEAQITLWYIRPWKKVHDYNGIKTESFTIIVK